MLNDGLIQARDDQPIFDDDLHALKWVFSCMMGGSKRHLQAFASHAARQPEDFLNINSDLGRGDIPIEIGSAVTFLREHADWPLDDYEHAIIDMLLVILRRRLRAFYRA